MRRSLAPHRDLTRARLARRAFAIVAIGAAIPLVAVALRNAWLLGRMFWLQVWFPGDLEWMEGGQLYHAYRVLHGQPLYGDCSDGFVPFPYPPVHPALLAIVGRLFGLDYGPARLVSVVAFAVCCALVCHEVYQAAGGAGRGVALGAAALGAVAVSYPIAGNWYDKIRVDSVFMALLVGGAIASLPSSASSPRRRLGQARTALAAGLLTAAIFTKQTGIFFVPWICLFALWRHRRSGLVLTAATAMSCLSLLGALQWATEGRFWTFVFEVMAHHVMSLERGIWSLMRLWLFARFLPLLPLVALWLWHKSALRSRTVFWLGMLGCALVASIATTVKMSAYLNNVMTAALLCWPVAIMLGADLLRAMRPRSALRLASVVGLAGYATLQLYHLGFQPRGYLPTNEERRAARELNRFVRSLPGTVLFPAHSFLPIRQGRPGGQIHRQGYVDALESGLPDFDLAQCLPGIRADWLILDQPADPYFDAIIVTDYEAPAPVPDSVRRVPGMAKPDRIYRRKPDAPSSLPRLRRRALFDFESGSFAGWQLEGGAFRAGPAEGARFGQWIVLGHRGRFLASSFDPALGSWAVGTLRSPPFVLDRSHLGLRVGGGKSPRLRVVLEVDGEPARALIGPGYEVDMLVPKVWDVRELESKQARIVVDDQDDDPWGHILVDEIELFDVR